MCNFLSRVIGQRCNPQPAVFVVECNLPVIGRPFRLVTESLAAAGDLLRGRGCVLRHHVDLLFAACVREESYLGTVRGPSRPFVVSPRRMSEVACRTFFDGCGKYIAAGGEKNALS